jgi:cellobiose phosphorylase
MEEINRYAIKYRNTESAKMELERVHKYWEKLLGTIQVKTNDRAIDILVNGWLLYQTLSCRINARAAFYQCGGAYGYRDQLQDTLSLMYTDAEALRNQIMIAASRQFEEGDVQHWWHPPIGMGVRTRISDDLHWLPYAVANYINGTEDYSILEEVIPYIRGPLLMEHEKEIMCTPEVSDMTDSVYEHCKRVIDHAKFGEHGLPLMGGGDWNDGMNEVGIEGKGESVWLAWFIYTMLTNFIPICEYKEDHEYAKKLDQKRKNLQKNIEKYTWDGDWYLRAFYDDGTKIGSKESDECRMDSISQSWSVISKAAKKERAMKAMQSAMRNLVKEEDGISLLLYPPFDKTEKNPGYIKNYYPGIRENGGQYTHAACWLAIASTMIEDYSMAYTLFTMLNPIHTTASKRNAVKYEKEPYVMIADISLSAPYTGRGGWSWYTGSGGWMYQGLVHYFLGLKKEKGYLILSPATPQSFGDFMIKYRDGMTTYEIKVESRSRGKLETKSMIVDGEKIEGNRIKLFHDDKIHQIII